MAQEEKRIFIGDQIKSVDFDKKEIVIKFTNKYESVKSIERKNKFLEDLLDQLTDFFSDVPIRGLSFVWQEEEKNEIIK